MVKWLDNARHFSTDPTARTAMLLKGFFMFIYGVWLALPIFDAFEGRPAYEIMAQIASDNAWGYVFITFGIITCLAAWFNFYGLVKEAAKYTFGLWTIIAFSFFYSDWRAPACIMASYISIQSAHHYLSIRKKARLFALEED